MKTITYYQCEICNDRYNTKEKALECEERGIPVPPPIGTIFNTIGKGNFYDNITFIVAGNKVNKHWIEENLWAFRDNSAGDSLDLNDRCGGAFGLNLPSKPTNTQHPTFKRAVEFCKKHNIKPMIWGGKKAVPYK